MRRLRSNHQASPGRFVRSLPTASVVLAMALALAATLGPATGPAGAQDKIERETLTFADVAALDELTSDHARVLRLYWAFFDREPDAAGSLYWLEQYEQCVSVGRIVDFFAESDEFVATYGSVDDAGFLAVIYRNVLDRSPDDEGLRYWGGLLEAGTVERADVMLYFSEGAEFVTAHPLPSDHVPGRGCRLGGRGATTPRQVEFLTPSPFAVVGPVTLTAPSMAVERIGFHQSTNDGALRQQPLPSSPLPMITMSSRNRDTDSRGAADVAAHPMLAVTSPVTGTVVRSGGYTLYCDHHDDYVVIEPDARPGWEVKVLHIDGVQVRAGDRVEAGVTMLAPRPRLLPFGSQIDRLTAEPSWPHVHIEVVDPTIPDRPSPGGGC